LAASCEYFESRLPAGLDHRTTSRNTADVYTSLRPTAQHLRKHQSLDAANVLPGLQLPLKELFASIRRRRRLKRPIMPTAKKFSIH